MAGDGEGWEEIALCLFFWHTYTTIYSLGKEEKQGAEVL
jgi:hypothetical protein